jgi:hypothetical protein
VNVARARLSYEANLWRKPFAHRRQRDGDYQRAKQ